MSNVNEAWVNLDCLNIKKNHYQISTYGNIRLTSNHKILKTFISNSGYARINLALNNGKQKKFSIHRLMGITFLIFRFKEQIQINHKDGNKLNNYIENLEWCSQSKNVKHAYDSNLTAKGENHHLSKYSDKWVHSVCKLLEEKKDTYMIIKELNLIDLNKYDKSSSEYIKVRNMIKKLRTKSFRRDIVLQYNY